MQSLFVVLGGQCDPCGPSHESLWQVAGVINRFPFTGGTCSAIFSL